jgi:hypothetical protein
LLLEPLAAFASQTAWAMPVTTAARCPVSMSAVGTIKKIGSKPSCATGGKLLKHPQFALAELE